MPFLLHCSIPGTSCFWCSENAKRCRAGEFLYGSAYLFCRELRFEIRKFLRAGQTHKISRRVAIDAVFSPQKAGPQFLYQKIVCFRVSA